MNIRELILKRIPQLKKHPYNGRFALVDWGRLSEMSDDELLWAFEKVVEAAYQQR